MGTHGTAIHAGVLEQLARAGFRITENLPFNPSTSACDLSVKAGVQTDPACLTITRYGPVYVRDGLIGAVNPGLALPPPAGNRPAAL